MMTESVKVSLLGHTGKDCETDERHCAAGGPRDAPAAFPCQLERRSATIDQRSGRAIGRKATSLASIASASAMRWVRL